MKDKLCARCEPCRCNQGAEELGVELDAHIAFCIEAMKKRAGSWAVRPGLRSLVKLTRRISCLNSATISAALCALFPTVGREADGADAACPPPP